MQESRPHSEFTNLDQAKKPEDYVELLDAQQNMAFIQQYKQRARVLLDLQPGQIVLDAGAGTGEDAQEMARFVEPTGQVIGLDLSQIMIDLATQRAQYKQLPVHFVQGNIQHLPFADNTFDRCYADKTFQHLPDPTQALAELIRVTRPDGLIVTADADHETQVIDTPYPDVTRRFLQFRNSGIRNPAISHSMYRLFKEQGLTNVQVEPQLRFETDYEAIRPVAHFIEGIHLAQENGVVTQEESERWVTYLEEAIRAHRFFYAITWFITIAHKTS